MGCAESSSTLVFRILRTLRFSIVLAVAETKFQRLIKEGKVRAGEQ